MSTYSSTILARSGLVAFYPAGDGDDTSPGNHDGVVQGTVTSGQPALIPNDTQTSTKYDGSTGTVKLPAFNLGDSVSVAFLVKRTRLNNAGEYQIVVSLDNGLEVAFRASNDTLKPQGVGIGKANYGVFAYSSVGVADTAGAHLIHAVKVGSTVRVYIDGNDVTATTGAQAMATLVNGAFGNSWIGSDYAGSLYWTPATVEGLAIYNRALTAAEVAADWQNAQNAPTGPTASLAAPANIGTTGVTLNGTVNPNGVACSCHFEYGPTTSYGTSTPEATVGSDSTSHAVSASLSGLAAGSQVHYRLVVDY